MIKQSVTVLIVRTFSFASVSPVMIYLQLPLMRKCGPTGIPEKNPCEHNDSIDSSERNTGDDYDTRLSKYVSQG